VAVDALEAVDRIWEEDGPVIYPRRLNVIDLL